MEFHNVPFSLTFVFIIYDPFLYLSLEKVTLFSDLCLFPLIFLMFLNKILVSPEKNNAYAELISSLHLPWSVPLIRLKNKSNDFINDSFMQSGNIINYRRGVNNLGKLGG